ncbi:MAG: alpha/beta hydrolase [Burkholderiaceae bacterium]|jgi:predicted alpha/beta hydrolase|nr:alpha/beta hydrolase [Burkholderiaceae bacterium]
MNTTTTSAIAAPRTGRSAAAAGADPVLVAQDGRHLAASWHEPDGPARAVAVTSSAAGVPRGYYRAFAGWLAQRGYAVLSYDYRGIGGSRRGSVRDDPATMRDWAVLDMSAALAAAEARRASAGLPLLLVGHSFGGNAIAFADGVERADALLMVASQLGEPRLYPGVHRAVAHTFFRSWLPAVLRLHGHAPGWALGPGAEPLPAGVARQWAHWGLTRGWAYADPEMAPHRGASAVLAPVHLWNLSDDLSYAPPRAVDALAAMYRNAVTERHTLTPQQVGVKRLGHFGAFRREPGARLWQRLLGPIEQASARLRDARLAALD